MKQSIKSRLDRVSVKIGAGVDDRCYCTMKDGSERVYYGMTILQDFLDEQIKSVRTTHADIAALLRAFCIEDTTVDIIC